MTLIQVDEVVRADPQSARLPHDEKYARGAAFLHGEYCALQDATIPLMDMGFFHSDAVYDVATVSKGRYFRLQDHFERFSRSCEMFRLRNPHTEEAMLRIFNALLRSAGLREANVFWCVTRGLPKPGANSARDRNKPEAFENRFYAMAYPYASIATQEQRNRGFDITISEQYMRIHPRAVDPRAKNFHWMDMKLSLFEARDRGKDWSILTDAEGNLTEAPGANIFVLKAGQLYTPEDGCLEGITRRTALELADLLGIRTHIGKVHARQLKSADDAFLTTSAGGIIPVNSVDGIVLGGREGAGEVTAQIHDLYWEKLWRGWKGTPVDYQDAALG